METPFIITNAYAASPQPFYMVEEWSFALHEWQPFSHTKHVCPTDANNVIDNIIKHPTNRRFRVVAYDPTVIRIQPPTTPLLSKPRKTPATQG